MLVGKFLLASPTQVTLRPGALFETFGEHKSIAITACDRPIFPPSIAIPPAVPAPADYARTVRRFSRSGRLLSPTDSDVPDSSGTDETITVSERLTQASNTTRHKHRYRSQKPEEVAIARARRGAVIPGTKAHRHPNDPEPVEPFAVTVEGGGHIALELVCIGAGKRKSAHRAVVLGPGMQQAALSMEARARGACHSEVQRLPRSTGSRKLEEEVMAGGRGEAWDSTQAAVPSGEQDGLPRTGKGGGPREKVKRRSDGERPVSQSVDCPGGEKRENLKESDDEPSIAVVVAEEEALDGVHGAPVFLGGQLFGFAIQV